MKKKSFFKHMLNFFSISVLLLIPFLFVDAQTPSVIEKVTVGEQYSRHTITKLNFLRPDEYNRAVDNQLGIIGNDFFGVQKLLKNKNDNSYEKTLTATDYYAVTGFKATLCGKTYLQDFNREGIVDDDLNLHIICNPKNPVFTETYDKIKNTYNNKIGFDNNIYPWAIVEGEVDINDGFQKFFDPRNSGLRFPIQFKTDMCLYGPWVQELYDPDEDIDPRKDHIDVHEIHPSEQFWWAEKKENGFQYFLNAANDASLRFLETGWTSNSEKNTFAIAFDVPKPGKVKNKIIYRIGSICNQNITPLHFDSKKHYLILGTDTLIEVIEPQPTDLVSVSFELVGIDPFTSLKSVSDSLIKGFIVLQYNIRNDIVKWNFGNLKLVVDKKIITNIKPRVAVIDSKSIKKALSQHERPDSIQESLRSHFVKITLKEISTLENKFSSHGKNNQPFKLVGYIFAEKENNIALLSKSSSEILEGKPQLLFPLGGPKEPNRIIRHTHSIKSNSYNNSVILSINLNESISLFTDFVASSETSYIRTLELIEKNPYYEIKMKLNDLKKGEPIIKEIILHNWEKRPGTDPKEYKMKIKVEFLLLN